MNCNCDAVKRSHKEKPFYYPGAYKPGKNNLYQCPCGQRWFCYNDYYCLWGRVNDALTWKFLLHDVDVPFSIGGHCVVVSGYEKYATDPACDICADKVSMPTINIWSAKGEMNETVVLQWTGVYDEPGNIFRYQFEFPILMPSNEYGNSISSFLIAFVGQIKEWPNKDQRMGMASCFNDSQMEKYVAHLISAQHSKKYDDGSIGPASFIAGVALLGDPNVGVIKPARFFDPTVVECMMESFKQES